MYASHTRRLRDGEEVTPGLSAQLQVQRALEDEVGPSQPSARSRKGEATGQWHELEGFLDRGQPGAMATKRRGCTRCLPFWESRAPGGWQVYESYEGKRRPPCTPQPGLSFLRQCHPHGAFIPPAVQSGLHHADDLGAPAGGHPPRSGLSGKLVLHFPGPSGDFCPSIAVWPRAVPWATDASVKVYEIQVKPVASYRGRKTFRTRPGM